MLRPGCSISIQMKRDTNQTQRVTRIKPWLDDDLLKMQGFSLRQFQIGRIRSRRIIFYSSQQRGGDHNATKIASLDK